MKHEMCARSRLDILLAMSSNVFRSRYGQSSFISAASFSAFAFLSSLIAILCAAYASGLGTITSMSRQCASIGLCSSTSKCLSACAVTPTFVELNLQTRIVIQLRDSVHIVSSEHISFFACRFDKAHLLRRSSEISDENIYIHRPEIWVKPIENFRLAIQELGPRTHNHEIWKPAMAVQHTEELFEGICLFWALQRF